MQMVTFMTAIGRMTRRMAMEPTAILTVQSTEVSGKRTNSMETAWRHGRTEHHMKEPMWKARSTDRDASLGLMAAPTLENS